MAKAGKQSRVGDSADAGATKERLVNAAIETLRHDGFVGASARTIAKRAECNQSLVFYHFGSVTNLLLAALDHTSQVRLGRYRAAVTAASTPLELVAVAAEIYREDLDAGHITVLAEMIAGSSSTPGLDAAVSARIAPWIDFAETAIGSLLDSTPFAGLIAPSDAAYVVVALYLGVELLSHLSNDTTHAESLLAAAERAANLLTLVSPTAVPAVPAAAKPSRTARQPEPSAPRTRRRTPDS